MKGDIGRKLAEWRNLTRGGLLENTEQFLRKNSDLSGFFRERSEAGSISRHRSQKNAQNYAIEKNQKYIQLLTKGVPRNIARLMIRNPDFVDVSFGEVIKQYQYFVEQGVSEVAAAVFASTDYLGRGTDGLLEKISVDYHVAKSSGAILELPFYIRRYNRLFSAVSENEEKCKELSMAFYVMDGLDGRLGGAVA